MGEREVGENMPFMKGEDSVVGDGVFAVCGYTYKREKVGREGREGKERKGRKGRNGKDGTEGRNARNGR
jgi:hypothetical protein